MCASVYFFFSWKSLFSEKSHTGSGIKWKDRLLCNNNLSEQRENLMIFLAPNDLSSTNTHQTFCSKRKKINLMLFGTGIRGDRVQIKNNVYSFRFSSSKRKNKKQQKKRHVEIRRILNLVEWVQLKQNKSICVVLNINELKITSNKVESAYLKVERGGMLWPMQLEKRKIERR